MRPYSEYLDLVKQLSPKENSKNSELALGRSSVTRHVPKTVKYDLSSTTPPLPRRVSGALPKQIVFDPEESRKSKAYGLFQKQISDLSGFKPNSILPSLGSSSAFFQALAAVTSPGETVLIETPTYEPFISAAQFLSLKIKRFKRSGDFETDLKNLKALGVRVLVISNPNSPTGWLYSQAELAKLVSHFEHVIVDEVFLPVFANEVTRASRKLVETGKLISISGLSKSLGLSSLRVGWIAASEKILRDCDRIGLNTHCDVPTPSLSVATAILPRFEKITASHRALANANRAILIEFSRMHPGVMSHDFAQGHFGTLKVPRSFESADAFARALFKKSVKVVGCEPFGLHREVRLSAWIPPTDFKTALAVIESFY